MGRRKKQEEEAAVEEDVADTAAAQEALLSAVEDGEENDFRPFLSLFVSSNATAFIRSGISVREQRKLLLAAINGLHKPVARRFFSALGSLVKAVLEDEEFVPSSMSGDYGDDDDDDDEEVVPDRKSSDALQFLFFATQAVQAYLDGLCEKHTNPNAVLQVLEEVSDIALSLHDVLFRLDSCGPDAVAPRQAIVSLCESWWLNNAANREQFLLQALPVLVRQAVTEGASVGTVKRLFAIREAFDCFDWLDPESDEFVQLLTRLSSVPGSLRSSEGKRFLSYLMSTDVTLMKALHQSFRAQIPDNKKTALAAYGDIYFRAWKEADDGGGDDEGVMRDALEQHVLQDLMVAVLQIKRNSMNQALLQVLQPFHDAKKNAQVEQLLHRMYGPILWRSLEASNAQVRWNAIQVLAEVFPLRDGVPSSNSAAAVNKACVALKNGLTDPDARVRVAAATAAAKILTMYWDVVPVKDIRDILNRKSVHKCHIFCGLLACSHLFLVCVLS
jgi:condensin-2 complex subunit G2